MSLHEILKNLSFFGDSSYVQTYLRLFLPFGFTFFPKGR